MKKHLMPEGGNFYKVNLHCHTSLSDGTLTPEEVKEIYKKEGYSAVAFTDHDALIPHHKELSDDEFIALNGFEITLSEKETSERLGVKRTCHMCFIAKDPENITHVCWFHRVHYDKNIDKVVIEDKPEFKVDFTPECVNEAIARAKAAGFYVTYNHPTWSRNGYSDYINFKGADAMEIVNYGCVCLGYPEYNERVYDDMLFGGERLACVAADDNHNKHPGTAEWDSFGAWVWVKADKLGYREITAALERGDYYASTGPEILDVYCEDGKIFVKTSPAARIRFSTGTRHAKLVANADGSPVTEASMTLKEKDAYVRITVVDEKGNTAYTRAYFLDEIGN